MLFKCVLMYVFKNVDFSNTNVSKMFDILQKFAKSLPFDKKRYLFEK